MVEKEITIFITDNKKLDDDRNSMEREQKKVRDYKKHSNYCNECGQKTSLKMKYCAYCGNKL